MTYISKYSTLKLGKFKLLAPNLSILDPRGTYVMGVNGKKEQRNWPACISRTSNSIVTMMPPRL